MLVTDPISSAITARLGSSQEETNTSSVSKAMELGSEAVDPDRKQSMT